MIVLFVIACIIVIGNFIRILILSNSLYRLNLNTDVHLETMAGPRQNEKIVIFAPHEDDEALGCAGFIQQAVAAGAKVHVVLMTNGEYPEISVVLFEETLPLQPRAFIRLGYMRQRETLAAMRYLGLPDTAVTFLGYPNQYLNQMWLPSHWQPSHPVRSIRTRSTFSPYNNSLTPRATYCGQSMLEDVETILRRERPDTVITIQPNDLHVDHWPTYAVVRFALEELAAENLPFARRTQVYTYLIHRDQWPAPRGYWPALNLEPPASLAKLGVTRWFALPLTVAQTIDKHKATSLYHTQGGSFDRLLLSFARANELYGILPLYSWPSQARVSGIEVIKDPARDLTSTLLNPQGDITGVRLSRDNRNMVVSIQTRGAASPKTGYHFTIHAGSGAAKGRIIAEYDWQGAGTTGFVLRGNTLRKVDTRAMQVRRGQNTATLSAPWPLTDNVNSFFLVRAWTTQGRAVIDQTAISTYLIVKAAQSATGMTPATTSQSNRGDMELAPVY